MWETPRRNWTSFLYLPERHMTGSYSWTKLSLNSRSEGHGGAGRGAVRTGPALSEVTSVGSVHRNTRKQSYRIRNSALQNGPPQPSTKALWGGGVAAADLTSYFRFQFRTHFTKKRGNFSPSTFYLRKTITTKFEFRREGAWVTMANSLRAFTTRHCLLYPPNGSTNNEDFH